MKKGWKVLLVIVAVSCFAVALSYPIRYRMADQKTLEVRDQLIAMRDAAIESEQNLTGETKARPEVVAEAGETAAAQSAPEAVEPETVRSAEIARQSAPEAVAEAAGQGMDPEPVAQVQDGSAAAPRASAPPGMAEPGNVGEAVSAATPEPGTTPAPKPTVDRYVREGALSYPELEKRTLDEDKILPRYRMIYEVNHDMAGWITIPGTEIDYPVVQCEDSDFYLSHDFFGEENNNGQIILDSKCDPYTPSYNLVISGHNMRSDKMFGTLDEYRSKSYWEEHKLVQFDTLMESKQYVIFACFVSADYDVDEEGFRYNADIQYRIEADQWFEEIRKNQLYDSEIDVEFGDEFLTLTTCNKKRRQDGRFVVVCRRIRQGEEIT